jgi:hypothetical protein
MYQYITLLHAARLQFSDFFLVFICKMVFKGLGIYANTENRSYSCVDTMVLFKTV